MIQSNLPVLMAKHGVRTLAEVVRQTGLSRTMLTAVCYSRGKGIPFDTMDALCEMFGIGIGELLIYKKTEKEDEKKHSIRQTLYRTGASKLQFQEPKTRGSKRVISLPDYAFACLRKHKAEQNEIKLRLGNAYNDYDLVVAGKYGEPLEPGYIASPFKKTRAGR
ncbi:helix-turn-helix domain-containing protein [Aneurinibacillus thermoaerophilus]|uniref:helix-turn-helix domain-containing protein n=1 Tax=Aneurinibacillus thermoaerophilus TaxID=143495 RepID=UPI002E249825|nr:helix-turn-helix domain-containing protein [Aneurinibacillus thermoaerophilus]MED0764374.1 helix-turn-helix domain-containing protein [Aneurinibacillus thermoaerophilus]